jgi:hypothetical protein
MESPGQLQLAPWDQATNHQSAVKARIATAQQAGLLSSDNWGHAAFGTSQCATSAAETYLLTEACVGPWHDLPRRRATLSRTTPISVLPAMTAPAQAAWIVPPIAAGS